MTSIINPGRLHTAYKLLMLEVQIRINESLSYNNQYNFQKLNKSVDAIKIETKDIALSNYLYKGICRFKGSIDALISKFSKIPIEQIDEIALTALRIGVFSIYKTRSPDHSSVHQSVEICTHFNRRKIKSFVNAILRNILRQKIEFDENINCNISPFIKSYLDRVYSEKSQAWLNTIQEEKPINIVYKEYVTDSVKKESIDSSNRIFKVIEVDSNNPSTWEGYEQGNWWIQDYSAYQAIDITFKIYKNLYNSANITVLDMCAAPGGKTFVALQKGAKVFACDISQARIDRMYENLFRLKFTKNQIFVRNIDLSEKSISQKDIGKFIDRCNITDQKFIENQLFDIVILDAPCTSSGLIRKHPDIRWLINEQSLSKNTYIQSLLLKEVDKYLRDGGIVLYAVCSVFLEEGQKMVSNFIQESSINTSWTILDTSSAGLPIGDEDGFQYFVLQKNSNNQS